MMQQSQSQSPSSSRPLDELSTLVLNILRSPSSSAPYIRRRRVAQQITPAGVASLMLGISLTLMLCGSVTFFIGFLLLPWVIGLVMVFYFVGLVSSLSFFCRMILCYATSNPTTISANSPKDNIPAWKFL